MVDFDRLVDKIKAGDAGLEGYSVLHRGNGKRLGKRLGTVAVSTIHLSYCCAQDSMDDKSWWHYRAFSLPVSTVPVTAPRCWVWSGALGALRLHGTWIVSCASVTVPRHRWCKCWQHRVQGFSGTRFQLLMRVSEEISVRILRPTTPDSHMGADMRRSNGQQGGNAARSTACGAGVSVAATTGNRAKRERGRPREAKRAITRVIHKVPFVAEFIVHVNDADKRIEVVLPRGLANLGRRQAYLKILTQELPPYLERTEDTQGGKRKQLLMPTLTQLTEAGRPDLVHCVVKAGGVSQVHSPSDRV
jgi:hypothetical protein